MENKAIILLSGGLDSTTILALAKSKGYECYCISFVYGQKHLVEIEAASKIAKLYNVVEHKIINIDLSIFQGSSLTSDVEVPKHKDLEHLKSKKVPSTYVHGRNTIFLAYAFGYAESINVNNIFIGCNSIDYSNYPDCRPEYLSIYERLLNIAKARVAKDIKIHAPLLHLTKTEIIMLGKSLGIDYSLTNSCYDPDMDSKACGRCDACLLRLKGFNDAGLSDPVSYIG